MLIQNHIINYDQTLIINLLKQNTALLNQLLTSSPAPHQPKPLKRTSLKQTLREDFKTSFYKKWNL